MVDRLRVVQIPSYITLSAGLWVSEFGGIPKAELNAKTWMLKNRVMRTRARAAEEMAEAIDPSLLPIMVGDLKLRWYRSCG